MQPMRRRERKLSEERAWELLGEGEYAVLATRSKDGWPYAVPVCHVVMNGSVYVHGAIDGHKVRNIAEDDRVCLSVVARHQQRPSELSVDYQSVVAFGRAKVAAGEEWEQALLLLGEKYAAGYRDAVADCVARDAESTLVIRIDVTGITGKRGAGPDQGGSAGG